VDDEPEEGGDLWPEGFVPNFVPNDVLYLVVVVGVKVVGLFDREVP